MKEPVQGSLSFSPSAKPVRPLGAPPHEQRTRLARRNENILDRLEEGPATGYQLLAAGGGIRYSARIMELREVGYVIDADPIDRASGIWLYTLRSKP